MGEREQGRAASAQTPPTGADHTAVPLQLLREEVKGRAGHVDTRRVNKHVKPLVETVLLVENPSTKGFTTLSAQLPSSRIRLERAQWRRRTPIKEDDTRTRPLFAIKDFGSLDLRGRVRRC